MVWDEGRDLFGLRAGFVYELGIGLGPSYLVYLSANRFICLNPNRRVGGTLEIYAEDTLSRSNIFPRHVGDTWDSVVETTHDALF